MDEQTLHDDLIAISAWVDPVVVPDTEHLDAQGVVHADDTDHRPGVPWQRTLLAAAAVVLVIGGVWVLTGRDDSDPTVAPTPTSTPTSVDPGDGTGWQEVPAAPLQPRAEAQVQWTGSEFVVFAGSDQAPCPLCDYASYGNTRHDAAAYNPATNAWRSIADLPKDSSYIGTSAVVDGDVYWMSVRNPNTNETGIDATLQRWSSTDDTWTEVALPTEVPGNPKLFDMGGKLLLYPGTDEVGAFPDQLFDGTSWTPLPDDPLGFASGRQFLMLDGTLTLFGTEVQRVMPSPTPTLVIGASYDENSATWTRLPDSDQLTVPMVALGATAYAPLGGGANGGEVNNWGRTVPNGGSYSAANGWQAFPPTVPDDLMGVVSIDGAAVLGVQGHVLHADDGTYSAIPPLPDGLRDQFGQAVANGDGLVFTFGGGLGGATGGQGVHARGFVWVPGAVGTVTPDTTPSGNDSTIPGDSVAPTDEQSLLNTALVELGIDAAGAPEGALDLAGGTFCGYEEFQLVATTTVDTAGRGCFRTAWADEETAIFIQQLTTNEGDPVAYVWRTLGGGSRLYIDATRDNFGSGKWSEQGCPAISMVEGALFTCEYAPPDIENAPAIVDATDVLTTFCDGAVTLLQSPDLGAVRELIADLRAVDTSALSGAQSFDYQAGIAALEDRVGSPDGYDTQAVTDSVNEICSTELSAYYATP